MPSRVIQPLVEVFLLVEQPRQRLSHWSQALAALDGPEAPPAAAVDAYYDPTPNLAIFGLRYDELTLGTSRLRFIVEIALLAEIGMIQPAALSETDRRRFVGDRLSSCTVHVADQRKVVSALVELVRRVSPRTMTAGHARPTRGDTGDPLLLVAPKGTQSGTSPVPRMARAVVAGEPALPRTTRGLAHGSVRQARAPVAAADTATGVPKAEHERVISEPITTPARRLDLALPQRRPITSGLRPSPNVIARGTTAARAAVVPGGEPPRIHDAANLPPEPEIEMTGEPYLPTTPAPAPREMIYARYLRGGRWVPIRVGSLSLKGAALMAVALPRVDDRVHIALAYAHHRALVRGAVAKVSTQQEAAISGATTFSVVFELDDGSRRQLTTLLTAARAAKLTIKPPPPRSTRRYPVEWPVCLGTTRGAVRAEALDVSADGMFVKPLHALTLDANVTFSAVLDDGLAPVSGRGRVVRNVTEADARTAGLSSGYGLLILEMADPDRERWDGFLARIEKRAAKRVLIGASTARLAELQSGLVAAGYAVTGGTDPGVVAQLASAAARPVDAALIDAAWLEAGDSPSWIEAVFSVRNVPCVTMHGDARRARTAIDRLLAVV